MPPEVYESWLVVSGGVLDPFAVESFTVSPPIISVRSRLQPIFIRHWYDTYCQSESRLVFSKPICIVTEWQS